MFCGAVSFICLISVLVLQHSFIPKRPSVNCTFHCIVVNETYVMFARNFYVFMSSKIINFITFWSALLVFCVFDISFRSDWVEHRITFRTHSDENLSVICWPIYSKISALTFELEIEGVCVFLLWSCICALKPIELLNRVYAIRIVRWNFLLPLMSHFNVFCNALCCLRFNCIL